MNGFKFGRKFERMKEINFFHKLLPLSFILFFLTPYIVFLKFISFPSAFNYSELAWALRNSAIQATASAGLCVILGFYLSFGLFQLPSKLQNIVGKLGLLPFILPSLFSILIVFSLINPLPMGHISVIIIFFIMNLGFSVLQISTAIKEKVGAMAVASEVYGISKKHFRRKILLPLIASDLKLNFILIFLFCLASLAVPLAAGGGKGTNLEVLIYEKVFIDQSWDIAWLLIAVQGGLIFLLSALYLKPQSTFHRTFQPHIYLKSKISLLGLISYLIIFTFGYFVNLMHAFSYLDSLIDFQSEILQITVDSLKIVTVVLVVFSTILFLWILDYVIRLKLNRARHLISVSTVLVGFSFYLVFPQTKPFDFIKLPLAYCILFFPGLFKMFFEKKMVQLHPEIAIAKIYNINLISIIFKIIFPQIRLALWMSASLVLVWVLSDFAIARALGTQTATIGLQAQNFLASYRLESAYLLSFYILLIWFILSAVSYFLIKGYHGSYKKH